MSDILYAVTDTPPFALAFLEKDKARLATMAKTYFLVKDAFSLKDLSREQIISLYEIKKEITNCKLTFFTLLDKELVLTLHADGLKHDNRGICMLTKASASATDVKRTIIEYFFGGNRPDGNIEYSRFMLVQYTLGDIVG